MIIKVPTKGYRKVDIGPLDSVWMEKRCDASPTMLNIISWRSTVCCACRKRFEPEDVMVCGFKKHNIKGVPQGMRFHKRCWDGSGKVVDR